MSESIKIRHLVKPNTDNLRIPVKNFVDKEIEITIKELKNLRSYSQNAYYWGVVIKMIADHVGDDKDAIHEFCKQEFGMKKVLTVKLGTLTDVLSKIRESLGYESLEIEQSVPLSTTRYNTKQFEEYLDKVRWWALDFHGLHIPLPNEVDIPNYYFTN